MTKALQISVLGELQVLREGREIVLPRSKKTRALLAYLAVTNKRQRREHLCEVFWNLPDDPRASLRWSLTKLRELVNRDRDLPVLTADADSVGIEAGTVDVDALELIPLAGKRNPALTTPEIETLASKFRGRFLEGLDLPRCPAFERWRLFHGDALDRTRSLLLQELVDRLRDEPARAYGYAQTLLSLNETGKTLESTASPGSALREARRQSRPAGQTALDAPRALQQIRYCKGRDGVQIAHAISGQGPSLLRAAHWMSHLQYEWESPVWRHWIDSLSKENTLVRYDERGNGLSDWNASDLSFEAMVADLENVADANSLIRFALLGVSQSCAVSVAYAVRHPNRVSHLILYGGYAKGWRKRGNSNEVATHDAMTTLIREGWGKDNAAFRQLFTETFIPGASREQMAWFNDLQRKSASPTSASRLHSSFGDMDVSELLGKVTVPTLVLHARHDAAVPYEQGKALARGIPGARFVDLNSANHILLEDEPAFGEFMAELRAFISSGSR